MGTLENIMDPILDLVLKRVSKFVIPKFCDTLLVPKITKCGDLLYFPIYPDDNPCITSIYIINQKVIFTITNMMKYFMYIGYDWPQTVA